MRCFLPCLGHNRSAGRMGRLNVVGCHGSPWNRCSTPKRRTAITLGPIDLWEWTVGKEAVEGTNDRRGSG